MIDGLNQDFILAKVEKVLKVMPDPDERVTHQILEVSWDDPITGSKRRGSMEQCYLTINLDDYE